MGGDPADAVVGGIGDVEVSLGVESEAARRREACGTALAVGKADGAACEGRDVALRVDLADAVVGSIGDVEVSLAIAEEMGRCRKGGSQGRAIEGAGGSSTREGGDFALGVDLADTAIAEISDVQVVLSVDRQIDRGREAGLGGETVQESGRPGAREGGDFAGGVELADTVVGSVGDIEVSEAVEDHARRGLEASERNDVIGEASEEADPGVGRDASLEVDPADTVVSAIRDVEEAIWIDGDRGRPVEAGIDPRGIDVIGSRTSGEGGDISGGVDLSDEVEAVISDKDLTREVDREVVRVVEGSGSRRAIGLPGSPGACEGGDVALGVDLADTVIGGICDVEISRGGDGKTARIAEEGLGSRSVAESGRASTRDRGDMALGVDLADTVVVEIGDVKVVDLIDRQTVGIAEAGGVSGSIDVVSDARSSEVGHLAGGVDLADAVVGIVGDVEIAETIDGDPVGEMEGGRRAGSGGISAVTAACEGGDFARGVDLADTVVGGVCDVEIAEAVGGDAHRFLEDRGFAGSVA